MLSSRYQVAGSDIVAETFDGDVVVLDLSCGKYFSFNDSACALWEGLSSGVRPDALLGGAHVPASAVETLLGQLLEYRLLAASAEPAGTPSPALLDRLAAAKEPPEVTVFDDLADLFLADPIHDVEEPTGWPAVKQA